MFYWLPVYSHSLESLSLLLLFHKIFFQAGQKNPRPYQAGDLLEFLCLIKLCKYSVHFPEDLIQVFHPGSAYADAVPG